jgi:hypothetical protein
MYCLSPSARENWGVTSFQTEVVRFESLWSLGVLDGGPSLLQSKRVFLTVEIRV